MRIQIVAAAALAASLFAVAPSSAKTEPRLRRTCPGVRSLDLARRVVSARRPSSGVSEQDEAWRSAHDKIAIARHRNGPKRLPRERL